MDTKRRTHSVQRRAYKATRSFMRLMRPNPKRRMVADGPVQRTGLRVAFIFGEKKVSTGAGHINQLMAQALESKGAKVKSFYPRVRLGDTPSHMRGFASALFFHSLLEHKEQILKNHIIQGTTFTPLPFLTFGVPVISHFGSTTQGFLDAVPRTRLMPRSERDIYSELYNLGIIPEFDYKTFRPLEDTADIEAVVAVRATRCVATSLKVAQELEAMGVMPERIEVIHNAIEDYWFATLPPEQPQPPHIVFLGRLGGDVFTLKLKGLARLVQLYRAFPNVPKTTVCMTHNKKLKEWLRVSFPLHYMFVNLRKDLIPGVLSKLYGSILFMPSRYEGFSLSLVEGMSQGLVPVSYAVGIAPEIIRNGENGYIVSTREEAQARIDELLANTEKRLQLAGAARETARQFTASRLAGQLLDLYRKAREETRRPEAQPNE